jgi:hypothetical protein
MLNTSSPARFTHSEAQGSIREQSTNGVCRPVGIAIGKQQSSLLTLQLLNEGCDIASHHGDAIEHGFGNNSPEGLLSGRYKDQVALRVDSPNIGLETGEGDAIRA